MMQWGGGAVRYSRDVHTQVDVQRCRSHLELRESVLALLQWWSNLSIRDAVSRASWDANTNHFPRPEPQLVWNREA